MVNVKYTNSADFRCLENLRQTDIDTNLIHVGIEDCRPNHVLTLPRDEYIIHFILSGSGFYTANGNTHILTAGQMFLIHPSEEITYGSDPVDPWSYAWIGFNGVRATSLVSQFGFTKEKLVLPAPDQNVILDKINSMLEHKTLTIGNELRRKCYMLLLFADLIDFHAEQVSAEKKEHSLDYSSNVYVEHAVNYIKVMYHQGINVSRIAEDIGVSRTHLNQLFQKELGVSAQKFLIDFRMHKAAQLLMTGEYSVKEVASMVGYEDQLTFSKAFKKKFEISPSYYKDYKDQVDQFSEKQI
ncbi:MAG: helix-turn-helix domain-containing protein [Lachnospiraceae bacterium]|nr:helix-turn-helix domain-containing protein [Lachnospiraceae bacterium]